ncbi:hypothetical protein U1Q18_037868 [Sarracenia purpurea var. burkii]
MIIHLERELDARRIFCNLVFRWRPWYPCLTAILVGCFLAWFLVEKFAMVGGQEEVTIKGPVPGMPLSDSRSPVKQAELLFIGDLLNCECGLDSTPPVFANTMGGKRKEKGETVIKVAAKRAIPRPAEQNRGPGQPRCSSMNPALHQVSGVSPSKSGVLAACLNPPLCQADLASKFNQIRPNSA